MRLLVIEDEARIAELLAAALTRAGFTVDAVGGCEVARAAFAVATYDAVILDLGLPLHHKFSSFGEAIVIDDERRDQGARRALMQ